MSWLENDERNIRRHRPPAQHHEPPLGEMPDLTDYPKRLGQLNNLFASAEESWDSIGQANLIYYLTTMLLWHELEHPGCGDCGWTPEGEWVPCEEHEGEEEPR